MSGGMDTDWRRRERALRRALKLHGDKTHEQLIEAADDLHAKILVLEDEIRIKQEERRRLDNECGDLSLLFYAHASEIEAAREPEEP